MERGQVGLFVGLLRAKGGRALGRVLTKLATSGALDRVSRPGRTSAYGQCRGHLAARNPLQTAGRIFDAAADAALAVSSDSAAI